MRSLHATLPISYLTNGTTYMATLNPAFKTDVYRFTGTVGQRLFYDALDADNDAISASLYDPLGNIFLLPTCCYFNGNSDADFGPLTLAFSGAYTLVIKGSGDYISDYSFRLLDLAAAPAITYGVNVTNQLNPQLQ